MSTRTELSKKEIINLLQKCEKEHGKVVERTYTNYLPRSQIMRKFESPAHAKIEAGIHNIGAVRSKHMRKLLNDKIENDDYINEVLTGLMMSDASATKNTEQRNTQIQLEMVNKEFVEYIRDILGPLATDVKTYTKQTSYNKGEIEVYKLRTRRLSGFNSYRDDWYTENGKVYPINDIKLTPTVLKMWYVGDGGISTDNRWRTKHYASISCFNEIKRADAVDSLFDNLDFHPKMNKNGRYRFSLEDSKRLWAYIGDEVPGYEYKWPYESYYK